MTSDCSRSYACRLWEFWVFLHLSGICRWHFNDGHQFCNLMHMLMVCWKSEPCRETRMTSHHSLGVEWDGGCLMLDFRAKRNLFVMCSQHFENGHQLCYNICLCRLWKEESHRETRMTSHYPLVGEKWRTCLVSSPHCGNVWIICKGLGDGKTKWMSGMMMLLPQQEFI